MSEKLLRVSEASQALSLTPDYLYKLTRNGELEAVRVGRRGIRISESAIKEWVEKRKK